MGYLIGWLCFLIYVGMFVLTPIFLIIAKKIQGLKIYATNFFGFILEIVLFFVVLNAFAKSGFLGELAGLDKAVFIVILHILHLIGIFIYSIVIFSRPAKNLPPPIPVLGMQSEGKVDPFAKGESPF